MLAVVFIRFIMKNLFNHFRNSILAVFFTSLIPLLLCFYDIEFSKLVLLIFCFLPILLLLDFCLWIVFYKKEIEKEFIDLELLQKALNDEKNRIPEVTKEQRINLTYGRRNITANVSWLDAGGGNNPQTLNYKLIIQVQNE